MSAARSEKPRKSGITVAIDDGLSLYELEGALAVSGPYIDVLMLDCGWPLQPDEIVKKKAQLCRKRGITVASDGLPLERSFLKGEVADFMDRVRDLGLTGMEVSNSAARMTGDEERTLLTTAKEYFDVVFVEVGKKDPGEDHRFLMDERIRSMEESLSMGAFKVIVEGGDGMSVGPFDDEGRIRESFVERIVERIDPDKIVWEAPLFAQQVWMVKRFGPNVNLGRIEIRDVIRLEALRRGLSSETLRESI
ncbi:TPA: phosphosulfolactate synthase [Candidatus Bathyarchaeota archaeon]|nr:phosphosulfolactate synthase [Candidatus Bathyarchaeota archaeon]